MKRRSLWTRQKFSDHSLHHTYHFKNSFFTRKKPASPCCITEALSLLSRSYEYNFTSWHFDVRNFRFKLSDAFEHSYNGTSSQVHYLQYYKLINFKFLVIQSCARWIASTFQINRRPTSITFMRTCSTATRNGKDFYCFCLRCLLNLRLNSLNWKKNFFNLSDGVDVLLNLLR